MWPFLLALLGGAGGATAGVGAATGASAGAAGGMSLGNMMKFTDLLKTPPTPKPTDDNDFPPLAARNLDLLTTNLGFGGGPRQGNYP